MSADIHEIHVPDGLTRLPMDPDKILVEAHGQLKTSLVLGYDHEGKLYFASSEPDGPEVLWLLEKAKQMLMEISA